MKPTEIKLTFEGIDSKGLRTWIGATFVLDNETLPEAALEAKRQIKQAYDAISSDNEPKTERAERVEMTISTPEFLEIKQRNRKVSIVELQKHYILNVDVMDYLTKNDLLTK